MPDGYPLAILTAAFFLFVEWLSKRPESDAMAAMFAFVLVGYLALIVILCLPDRGQR